MVRTLWFVGGLVGAVLLSGCPQGAELDNPGQYPPPVGAAGMPSTGGTSTGGTSTGGSATGGSGGEGTTGGSGGAPFGLPDAGCDYRNWAAAAKAAAAADAAAAGVDLSSVSVYKIYAFPGTSSCGWAGLGELPGDESWTNGYANVSVIAHELDHNFGVHHASTTSCTDATGGRIFVSARLSDDCLDLGADRVSHRQSRDGQPGETGIC